MYQIGLKNELFGTIIFWKWFGYGAYQALIIFVVVVIFNEFNVLPDGMTLDLWM